MPELSGAHEGALLHGTLLLPRWAAQLGSAVALMGAQCWCLCAGMARCTNPSAVVPSLIKCAQPQAVYGEEKSVFHL